MPTLPAISAGFVPLLVYVVLRGLDATVLKGLQDLGMQNLVNGENPISFCNVFFLADIAVGMAALLPGRASLGRDLAALLPADQRLLALEESVPIVAETALAALGCIGTPASIQALVERDSHLRNPVLVRSLERQIQGQFRHLQDLAACIRTSQAEGRLSAERASQLLALISW